MEPGWSTRGRRARRYDSFDIKYQIIRANELAHYPDVTDIENYLSATLRVYAHTNRQLNLKTSLKGPNMITTSV